MTKKMKTTIAVIGGGILIITVLAGGFLYWKQLVRNQGPNQDIMAETEITVTEQSTEPQTETTTEPVTEPETEETTEETTEEQTGKLSEGAIPKSPDDFIIAENVDEFFEKSVFIGDSVMMGFRNYVMGQEAGFLNSPEFLVSGSFSVRMALTPISPTTIHPVYQGEQRYIWDSLAMMGAKKVFMSFGLNDIGMEGVEAAYQSYVEVIGNIQETVPEVDIYIISTTNMLPESEKQSLNNENIRLLNSKMQEYCRTAGIGYIDITSFLIDETGGLRADLCSDGYVHQTYAAYEIWVKVLRGYASGGEFWLNPEKETLEEETVEEESKTAAEAGEETEEETSTDGETQSTESGETAAEETESSE